MENLTQEEFYYSIITIRESLEKLVEEIKTLNATVAELKEKVLSKESLTKTACPEISESSKKAAREIMDMLRNAEKEECNEEQPVKKTAEKKTTKKAESSAETKEVSRKKKVRLDEEVK